MNKFEKLIEYIINDENEKARELFHSIVVDKSRDIYESIMDEEQMGEHVHGDQVGDMVDEIDAEESMHEGDDEEGGEEFSLDGEGEDGEVDGEFGGEEEFGDEEGSAEEHGEIEDEIMGIDAKLDELLAKFDEIMGGDEEVGGEEEFGGDEGGEEFGGDEGGEFGGDEGGDMEEPPMMEAGNPFASGKSGKSGSAASGKSGSAVSGKSGKSGSASAKMEAAKAGSAVSGKSGKSGSAVSGKSGKSGSGKMESKSVAEMMREYVEKVEDINLTPGTYSEGEPVGAGTGTKKVSVNTNSTSLDHGPDFGGTSENIVNKRGATNETPDGKAIPQPSNEYNKGQTMNPAAKKNVNVPGGNAGKSAFKAKEPGHGAESKGSGEGKTVGSGNSDKPNVNKKSELGQAGQPTGKKQ